jgi:hypothetical protein
MKNFITFLFLLVLAFTACEKDNRVTFESSLKGGWVQTEYDTTAQSYSIARVTFDCNTFTLNTEHHLASLNSEDSCSVEYWVDSIAGNYFLTGESIFMQGFYKDGQGQDKLTGCHLTGYYENTFKGKIFKDRLNLSSPSRTFGLKKVTFNDC